jgi:glucose-6-phosphate-specific signal transduction histidine kinase
MTLARSGGAIVGLGGYLAMAGLSAKTGHYVLGFGDRMLILVPIFLVAHVPILRRAWQSRQDPPADVRRARGAGTTGTTDIASLLHDTVGQGLTVISMRARSATGADRVQELSDIDDTAIRAMGELRQVLGYLHTARGQQEEDIFCGQLIDVVNGFRGAGVDLDFVASASEEQVPMRLRPVMVRVAREALSNAVKHDRGAAVTVELDVAPQPRLAVRTRSAAPAGPALARSLSSGRGTRMMHRLVTGHGGSLRIHEADGEFRVEAVFPVERADRHAAMSA